VSCPRARLTDRYNTFQSPHYNASHRAFRAKVRAFVDTEIMPYVGEVRSLPPLPARSTPACLDLNSVS